MISITPNYYWTMPKVLQRKEDARLTNHKLIPNINEIIKNIFILKKYEYRAHFNTSEDKNTPCDFPLRTRDILYAYSIFKSTLTIAYDDSLTFRRLFNFFITNAEKQSICIFNLGESSHTALLNRKANVHHKKYIITLNSNVFNMRETMSTLDDKKPSKLSVEQVIITECVKLILFELYNTDTPHHSAMHLDEDRNVALLFNQYTTTILKEMNARSFLYLSSTELTDAYQINCSYQKKMLHQKNKLSENLSTASPEQTRGLAPLTKINLNHNQLQQLIFFFNQHKKILIKDNGEELKKNAYQLRHGLTFQIKDDALEKIMQLIKKNNLEWKTESGWEIKV